MTPINHVLLGLVVTLGTLGTSCAPPPSRPPQGPDPGVAPGDPDLPIDPGQPMPASSLSTGATLVIGTSVTVVVDGRADLYSSGMAEPDAGRGGKLPGVVRLAPGGGYLTFSSVKGVVGCTAEDARSSSDGGGCGGGSTDLVAAGGISGIIDHQHTQFLAGVFLGPSASTAPPPALDFSANALGESVLELAPLIGQAFYVGNGLTEAGAHQRFVIPAGATRFFMAFADGYGFQGDPGAYGDNTGGLRVTLIQQAPGSTAVTVDAATSKAKLQRVANELKMAADGLTLAADLPRPTGATEAEKKAHAKLSAFARTNAEKLLELRSKIVEVLANQDASTAQFGRMSEEVRGLQNAYDRQREDMKSQIDASRDAYKRALDVMREQQERAEKIIDALMR